MGHKVSKTLDSYRAPFAYSVAGLPYQTGNYLAKTGVVVPSIAQAAGRGTVRLYSFRDLLALRVARDLRKAHLSLQRIRKCIVVLREQWNEDLATARLFTDGKEVYLARDEQKAIALLLQSGQVTWRACVDVGGAAAELRRLVAQEKPKKRANAAGVNRRKTA